MILGSVEELNFLLRNLNDGFFEPIFNKNLMNTTSLILLIIHTYVISSLIWARFTFFKVDSGKSKVSTYFYDPVVSIHIGVISYFIIFAPPPREVWLVVLACMFYLSGILLFWWGIVTAKGLNFAFGKFSGKVITSGPFRYVRHPFYVSYILIWMAGTFLFNSIVLWITLIYLVSFYVSSARKEERAILESGSAHQYSLYCSETNMFVPRIKSWKN